MRSLLLSPVKPLSWEWDPEVKKPAWSFLPSTVSVHWHLRAVVSCCITNVSFHTTYLQCYSTEHSAAIFTVSLLPSSSFSKCTECKHIYPHVIMSIGCWAQLLVANNSTISPLLADSPHHRLSYQPSQLSDGCGILMLSCGALWGRTTCLLKTSRQSKFICIAHFNNKAIQSALHKTWKAPRQNVRAAFKQKAGKWQCRVRNE